MLTSISFRQRMLAPVLCCGLVACTEEPQIVVPEPDEPVDATSTEDAETDYGVTSIDISPGELRLEPGETASVTVSVKPSGIYPLVLSLPNATDVAYVEDATLQTLADGTAKTSITVVATEPTAFELQASVGPFTTRTSVQVTSAAVATLVVTPVYTGSREFDEWVVRVVSQPGCGQPYVGDLGLDTWRFPATSETLTIDRVPARRPVTILLSAEQFVFGCLSGNVLTPMTENALSVPVSNESASISDEFDVPVGLNLSADSIFWSSLDTYLAGLAAEFRQGAASDSAAVLDRMQQLAGNPETFATRRQDADWDGLLQRVLTPEGAQNGLSSRIIRWLVDGSKLLQAPEAFKGALRTTSVSGRGELTLSDVSGLDPTTVGVPSLIAATMTVDGNDTFRVGFQLRFQASLLFGELAGLAFRTSPDAGSEGVAAALADALDCELMGSWLSDDLGVVYDDCGAECGQTLCESAIDSLWTNVLETDSLGSAFDISAAGPAKLDARARVVGFHASWVGDVDLFEDLPNSIQGSMQSLDQAE